MFVFSFQSQKKTQSPTQTVLALSQRTLTQYLLFNLNSRPQRSQTFLPDLILIGEETQVN